jgi:hypothetical protein
MTISRDELAAFADGELDAARSAEVAEAVAADATLQAQVDAHCALRAKLGTHFAPIHDEPVPKRLSALLVSHTDTIISFTAAKDRRDRRIPRWSWIAAPALAASLALAVFLPRGAGDNYATGALAGALEGQLVASQDADAPTRILVSFRNEKGSYCRAFVGEAQSGIACRDDHGWRLAKMAPGMPQKSGDYRMAGSPAAEVLERAQALTNGPALDATQEQAAKARGWRVR